MIAASGIELRAGSRLLLDGATFRIAAGDRVGLVGRNGAGKTTLTKVLAGQGQPAAGLGDQHRRGRLPAAGPAHRRPARAGPRPHPVGPRPRPDHHADARGRGRDGQRRRRDPRQGDAPLLAARGGVHHPGRVRRRVRGRDHRQRAVAGGAGARPAAGDPVRRPAPPRRAVAHPVLRRRRRCCSTSRPTTSTPTRSAGCATTSRATRAGWS